MNFNVFLDKLNTKMIFSRYSDSLVYFVEDLDNVNEDEIIKLGYYAISDGMELIDFKKNFVDDISNMYGVKSWVPREFSNLEDFYSEINFYDHETSQDQIISSFDVFLDRKIYNNARIYIGENGVTIKCENCYPGFKALINEVEYEVVDDFLLKDRITNNKIGKIEIDFTKLCTTMVTDMSYLFDETDLDQPIDSWDVSNVLNR
jgi:Zn finger protein HypA/HybF involved in hydrogenase expression